MLARVPAGSRGTALCMTRSLRAWRYHGPWSLPQITRFDIYDDFTPFFKDPSNADKVYRPSPGTKLVEMVSRRPVVGAKREQMHTVCAQY